MDRTALPRQINQLVIRFSSDDQDTSRTSGHVSGADIESGEQGRLGGVKVKARHHR